MSSARSEARGRAARQALRDLRDLHAELDAAAAAVAARVAPRLRCARGCSACCLDDLTVTAVEAERIREAAPALLEDGEPGPLGACAFLDEAGACRVYADRPSVCRTQGLPLRVLYENDEDEIVERRDICPLNLDGGPPLDALDESETWLVGPFELRLSEIDDRFAEAVGRDAAAERVPLRSLFRKRARPNRETSRAPTGAG